MSEFKHRRTLERQAEAQVRQEARDSRSDKEQLKLLVERNHGQCREAQLLRAVLS